VKSKFWTSTLKIAQSKLSTFTENHRTRLPGFFEYFEDLLKYTEKWTEIYLFLITGDFNLPGKEKNTIHTGLRKLLVTYDMTQLVRSHTRVYKGAKSLLDLLITKSSMASFIHSVKVVQFFGISDHKFVLYKLRLPKKKD
jgi:hypothetical protein